MCLVDEEYTYDEMVVVMFSSIDRNGLFKVDGFNFGSVEANCQMADFNFNSMPTFPAATIWYYYSVYRP